MPAIKGTIILNQISLNQQVKNVMVIDDMPIDDTERDAFADAFRLEWLSEIPTNQRSDDWSFVGLTFLYNASAPVFSVEVPFTVGPIVGTQGSPQASQVALLISTQSVTPKPNRGRVYFPGMPESALDNDGLFTQGVADDSANFIDVLAVGFNWIDRTSRLLIARRTAQGIITATNNVTSVIGRLNPATQRRRRIGVGA